MSLTRKIMAGAGLSFADSIRAVVINEDDAYIYTNNPWAFQIKHSALSCGDMQIGGPSSTVVTNANGGWFAVNGSIGAGAYDISAGTELWFHTAWIDSPCSLSPDRLTLIAGTNSGFYPVNTTDWTEGTIVATSADIGIRPTTAWTPAGTRLVAVGQTGSVNVYNTANWAKIGSTWTGSPINGITSVSFSPDGTKVIITGLTVAGGSEIVCLDFDGTTLTANWNVNDGIPRRGSVFISDTQVAVISEANYDTGGLIVHNTDTGAVEITSSANPPQDGGQRAIAINQQRDEMLVSILVTGGEINTVDTSAAYVDDLAVTGYASPATYSIAYY